MVTGQLVVEVLAPGRGDTHMGSADTGTVSQGVLDGEQVTNTVLAVSVFLSFSSYFQSNILKARKEEREYKFHTRQRRLPIIV